MRQRNGILRTLFYYASIVGLFVLLERTHSWGGGPCTPGVDFLILLLFGPLCLLLATVNLIRQYIVKKPAGGAAIIHIAAFIAWCIFLKP